MEKEISQKGVIEEGSDYKMGRDGLPMVFRELTMEMVMSKVKKQKTRAREKTEVIEAEQPEIQSVLEKTCSLIIFGHELKLRYFQSFPIVQNLLRSHSDQPCNNFSAFVMQSNHLCPFQFGIVFYFLRIQCDWQEEG